MRLATNFLKSISLLSLLSVGLFLAGCNNAAETPAGGEGAGASEATEEGGEEGAEDGGEATEEGSSEEKGTEEEASSDL